MDKKYICCDGLARILLTGNAYVYDEDGKVIRAVDLASLPLISVPIVDIVEVNEVAEFVCRIDLGRVLVQEPAKKP